ncbi:hypothetical protein F909_02408 [Acinetobacter sp. ANC 3929]|uniref:hypothetical protein n=1 Tax=unclassified Acinetobacter TaxID=196816 RepID=UPI0002D03B79|nr:MULTISPECIES: hypothetical protein [unclassified Acinetobacter]ENW81117.1 hypothetical protein F909_02408 [Acinetobacter sp. ANC 3929]MCH7351308.1 DUF1634 domain-containing protein [Acinetobacter sp. NIPH 2023]MCH7355637.1 DUF1634 domain-containing protein [Acinetobacter sp. NIPH 1958]MCH7358157.1 DUF1634 domain-containing protein [Acinetobacter sp. NIPH 2024]
MIILSLVLILIGMLLLYKCSSKQINKTKQALFIRYQTHLKILAYLCFLLAGSLLCLKYGSSIGFVSWWIFATPVTFLLVLWVNELKPTKK